MMARPHLRHPPGLSRLSREVIFDDHRSSTASNQGHDNRRSGDYKLSLSNVDEDVDLPLLPMSSFHTLQFPLAGETGSETAAYLNPAPRTLDSQREGQHRSSEYSLALDINPPVDSDTPPRRSFISSADANCSPTPTPSSAKFQAASPTPGASTPRFPRIAKAHPFARGYEYPQWRKLAIHVGLCALAYPFLLIFVIAARGKSLFWTRLFVGVGCGLAGVMLGISLLELVRGILEAVTWATIIHQSRVPDADGCGVRLKDLAAQSNDPTSSWPALRLLWDRHSYRGADRDYRKFYDKRNWSLWIILFLFNVLLSSTLPFILARVIDIDVQVLHQHEIYSEVAVQADLSADDLSRANAMQADFEGDALTWTLSPFSMHGSLPGAVSLLWENAPVYFSEIILSQLVPGGSGFGTFSTDATSPTIDLDPQPAPSETAPLLSVQPGSVLRFPRWGIRINCAKIPDAPDNIIPLANSNTTYVFTPQDTLHPLFDNFQMPFPAILQAPVNFTQVMQPNDTLPNGLNTSNIAMAALYPDDGNAHSIMSTPLGLGDDGNGFVTVETILVRLNDSYAPKGSFGVKGNFSLPQKDGFDTLIGYDAVVCLELYEPWVLEVYNSSVGPPVSMRIVAKGAQITDEDTQFVRERRLGSEISDPFVTRALNSTNMKPAFVVGHQNSVNQILKDNGHNAKYVPSPTLLSFTSGGSGPYDYTNLSAAYYAQSRALADASNVLPYFAGSGQTVARQYADQVTADAHILVLEVFIVLAVVLAAGAVSALFVPRLPLDAPQRGFDLYSWVAAFCAHELVPERTGGLSRHMDLKEIKELTGELKFRYVG